GAVAIHERNVASVERIGAAGHLCLVPILANLADALHEAGEDARVFSTMGPRAAPNPGALERARSTLERAASLAERELGAEHPDRIFVLATLGRVLVGLGRLDDAEPLLTRARDAYEKALGPASPRLAVPLLGLGELALARRRPTEAVPPLERALTV